MNTPQNGHTQSVFCTTILLQWSSLMYEVSLR